MIRGNYKYENEKKNYKLTYYYNSTKYTKYVKASNNLQAKECLENFIRDIRNKNKEK